MAGCDTSEKIFWFYNHSTKQIKIYTFTLAAAAWDIEETEDIIYFMLR